MRKPVKLSRFCNSDQLIVRSCMVFSKKKYFVAKQIVIKLLFGPINQVFSYTYLYVQVMVFYFPWLLFLTNFNCNLFIMF